MRNRFVRRSWPGLESVALMIFCLGLGLGLGHGVWAGEDQGKWFDQNTGSGFITPDGVSEDVEASFDEEASDEASSDADHA